MRNTVDPKLDFTMERHIQAPLRIVWDALTKPEHLQAWYMPKLWGRVTHAELDLHPGGIVSINIALQDGSQLPNVGCVLEVVPMERLIWTSMLFPGYRPAVFDDVPITAIMSMAPDGAGTRYSYTALHRNEADFEQNKTTGFFEGTRIAVDQFVEHAMALT